MIDFIDGVLNKITMYRLVLYYLIFLVAAAAALGYFGFLPYSPIAIAASAAVITFLCVAANELFARVFEAPTNAESVYITGLILALIITPPASLSDSSYLWLALWASLWAVASKYMLAVRKKHLFNPAAFGVALTSITVGLSATWWVGTLPMLPFTVAGGLLLVRKLRRSDLVWSFLAVAVAATVIPHASGISGFFTTLWRTLAYAPLFFFAFVMLTEPLTTPPARFLRICYGACVGFLFSPSIHAGSVYSTPELALLAGNVFSYLVSPKQKLLLTLRGISKTAADAYDFVFQADQKFSFRPGQYLEWTLAGVPFDSRGNRRYFTIASSPTEATVRVGVKFYPAPSGFKRALAAMRAGDTIIASQLSGEFVLPKDASKKLVFIAGGIGITPFRSMIKYLLDRNEPRPITVLYSNRSVEDIAYADIFNEARERLGIRTVYTLTDAKNVPAAWRGRAGMISEQVIREEVPDYGDRTFYLSGPHAMVKGFEETLRRMGVAHSQIKVDFFPGFA